MCKKAGGKVGALKMAEDLIPNFLPLWEVIQTGVDGNGSPVAQLRTEGKSQRDIGEALGIRHTQVQADLKEATGKGLPVKPQEDKITGSDGRKQPATKPPTEPKTNRWQLLCRPCRVGVAGAVKCVFRQLRCLSRRPLWPVDATRALQASPGK
jgi:hypothetical protein